MYRNEKQSIFTVLGLIPLFPFMVQMIFLKLYLHEMLFLLQTKSIFTVQKYCSIFSLRSFLEEAQGFPPILPQSLQIYRDGIRELLPQYYCVLQKKFSALKKKRSQPLTSCVCVRVISYVVNIIKKMCTIFDDSCFYSN